MVEEALVKAAIAAMGRAYAPYSKFPVGAAILDQDGAIHVGANIENATRLTEIAPDRVALVNIEGMTRVRGS